MEGTAGRCHSETKHRASCWANGLCNNCWEFSSLVTYEQHEIEYKKEEARSCRHSKGHGCLKPLCAGLEAEKPKCNNFTMSIENVTVLHLLFAAEATSTAGRSHDTSASVSPSAGGCDELMHTQQPLPVASVAVLREFLWIERSV